MRLANFSRNALVPIGSTVKLKVNMALEMKGILSSL